MKVIRESYRAGESWPFFVTLERGEGIRGYFRADYDALLALADELDGLGRSGFSIGWSSGAVNVGSFARRIREALGEGVGRAHAR